jgi:hypothetical protein
MIVCGVVVIPAHHRSHCSIGRADARAECKPSRRASDIHARSPGTRPALRVAHGPRGRRARSPSIDHMVSASSPKGIHARRHRRAVAAMPLSVPLGSRAPRFSRPRESHTRGGRRRPFARLVRAMVRHERGDARGRRAPSRECEATEIWIVIRFSLLLGRNGARRMGSRPTDRAPCDNDAQARRLDADRPHAARRDAETALR